MVQKWYDATAGIFNRSGSARVFLTDIIRAIPVRRLKESIKKMEDHGLIKAEEQFDTSDKASKEEIGKKLAKPYRGIKGLFKRATTHTEKSARPENVLRRDKDAEPFLFVYLNWLPQARL